VSSKEYPSDITCYELLEDCGRGVSATVHRAVVRASGEVVAVKKMHLERVSMGLVRAGFVLSSCVRCVCVCVCVCVCRGSSCRRAGWAHAARAAS
jgi:hypothetical protein